MIFRVTLFISLLSLFYYYCKEDGSTNQYREPNDINMIEVPLELGPTFKYESIPAASIEFDSTDYLISSHYTDSELASGLLSSVSQNY
ncbi:MAG: hypothetical protein KAQ62_10255 [Cyclobacteriaceae bacterium]|nr:hypothetical protein [Cyclobacteriaceae bacterium]